MAETVGQHSVAAFTSPVNGTTPIDANTVRGNDNTVRVAYVDHDADPGIHVQSSSLASRPVAGTVGRKWITVNSGRYQLWYDDGSRWHEVASDAVNVDCLADENLTKGDVVKVTGFNNGQNLPTVAKTTSVADTAFGIVENTVTSGSIVQIVNTGLIEDVNTNGYAVGTILYPNASAGFTSTKPTSGTYQPAAYVLRGNTSNGVLYAEFSAPRIVERSDNTASTIVLRDASGNFSAGTITATTLAGTLSTAAQPNVTSVGTLTSLAVSGDLTVDTSTLKVDSTNNRVGIGTASPSRPLEVAFADAETNPLNVGAAIAYHVNTDQTNNNYALTAYADAVGGASSGLFGLQFTNHTNNYGDFIWLTRGTGGYNEKMRLDASGNLGLGVTPSASDVRTMQFPTDAIIGGQNQNINFTGNAYFASGAWRYHATNAATWYQQSGYHAWHIAPSGTAGDAITFTQAMTLDASGNLGVGVTSMADSGHIYVAAGKALRYSSTAYITPENNTTGAEISTPGIITFKAGSGPTERARITSGGYFKASNDGTYVGATGAYHELRSSEATSACVYVQSTNASFTDGVVVLRASRAAGTAFNLITAQSNLVDQFSVRGDGTIFAQNTTVQSISDARLKENVVDATDGLNVITALRPVRYDWKAGYGNDRVNQLGFIAQEVEAVFPEAVSETTLDEETYKTVGPGALIPVLVKAIQELEARIAVLEAGA